MLRKHVKYVFVLFQDITERLRLESSLNLLTQVQKATLDTLDEGIAIFGTDGRLVLHNALFARMWKLSEDELGGQPHFAEIANVELAVIDGRTELEDFRKSLANAEIYYHLAPGLGRM